MYKNLRETEGVRNENQVYSIKLELKRKKKVIENKKFMIEENEKIMDIVERILYFNRLDQSRQGLKILTPNQMLGTLRICLAE